MHNFRNAKAGESVYSIFYGEGIIKNVIPQHKQQNIGVVYTTYAARTFWYDFEGKTEKFQLYPELYWHKPEIIVKIKEKHSYPLIAVLRTHVNCDKTVIYNVIRVAASISEAHQKASTLKDSTLLYVPATITFEVEK